MALFGLVSAVGGDAVRLAAEAEPLFQINIFQVVIAAVNFVVFLVLMWTFAFKPVSGMLNARRERIEQGLKDAEPFCERGEDDREAADLARSIRVPADGRGGQAGQDADADAGAKDPEGGESGADVLHVETSSYSPGCSRDLWDRVVGADRARFSGPAGAGAPRR